MSTIDTVIDTPFMLENVSLEEARVDDKYQRNIDQRFVDRAVARFDPHLVGVLTANRREDGFMYVIDGQARRQILLEMGVAEWSAIVYDGLTLEEEAAIFHKANRWRRAVPPWYDFRARLVAREPFAHVVDTTVAGEGFYLGYNSDDTEVIGAIRAVETAYTFTTEFQTQEGAALVAALRAIKKAWRGRKKSLSSEVIRGLSRFHAIYPNAERDLVAQVMAVMAPVQMLRAADERYRLNSHSHSRGYEFAAVMATEYNSVAPKEAQLDTKKLSAKLAARDYTAR